ncbi:MAG TPA: RNA polymerase sigma factor [Solirubrobacteraceae bacterium]|jgi:RNA polymerase sigma-70 factor (ECF subfamily)|nr:RNA polymerase sigma factor [Solirubrobacteraceae bacterium]
MMHEPGDAELLCSGDPADFGRFYERHIGALIAFLGARVRAPDQVFDFAAETFARALERREQYDALRGPAVAWLFAIARNLIIDSVRRARVADESRVRLGLEPIALDDEQLEMIHARSQMDLCTALAGLAPEQRAAVRRRVVGEEPYPDIAADLRCSEQVVRKRVSRGLANLREALEERS